MTPLRGPGSLVRFATVALTMAMPWRVRRAVLCHVLHWQLHPTSHIGLSMLDVDRLILDEGARIGHFTVVRGLRLIHIGTGSVISNWNWITAVRGFRVLSTRAGILRVGPESAITSRHYIDCSGGITIGAFVTVAGVRSTIFTHQISRMRNEQTIRPVTIGDRCLIMSNVKIAPGAYVARDSVVGMGAVVVGRLERESRLYAGVPAREVRPLPADDDYLNRAVGPVAIGVPRTNRSNPT